MIGVLSSYPTYKPSGVFWLGDVPKHWEIRRLGSVAAVINGATPSTSVSEYWDGHILWVTPDDLGKLSYRYIGDSGRRITEEGHKACGTTIAPASSIAISTRAPIGHLGILQSEGCVNQGCRLLVPSSFIQTEYLHYTLSNSRSSLASLGQGSTFTELSRTQLCGFQIPLPPLDEQAAIVRYLDYVDRRVRRYVAAKRKLIALLEEERQAVIHQAVTRGLDPNVPRKPSGVDWLGNIPAHWEVRRVKSLSMVKRGASPRPIEDSRYFDDGGEYAWVRIADVSASNHFLEKTTQRLSKLGQSLSVELDPGSLFLSIAGSVGKPIITRIKCCIHDGFVYFPQFRGNVEFLYRVFSCDAPYRGLGKLGTQLNLNTETVGDISLGWPPASEQREIADFLNRSSARLDAAIRTTRRQIELLEEYRTRLIADVVTGKLDVRAAAAELPDRAGDEEPLWAEGALAAESAPTYEANLESAEKATT